MPSLAIDYDFGDMSGSTSLPLAFKGVLTHLWSMTWISFRTIKGLDGNGHQVQ